MPYKNLILKRKTYLTWRKKNIERVWNHNRKSTRKYRLTLLALLGNHCICQENNCWHKGKCKVKDTRVLQLDHIKGNGTKEIRKKGAIRMYRYYIKYIEKAKKRLQVLCANCNWAKLHLRGESRNKYS